MPPDEAAVTVLLPTRNRRSMLEAVLPSYLDQDGVGQVLVLDDASTDGTKPWLHEVASVDRRVRVLASATPLGSPANKNRGLDAAETRYVFIGEDDAELPSGYMRGLLALMVKYGAAVVGSLLISTPFDGRRPGIGSTPSPDYWPSLELGPELREIVEDGVYSVLHVHAVALLDMTAMKGERYSEQFRGNAFREESDLYLRQIARGQRILLDRRRWFVHYQRSRDLLHTGNSEMGTVQYEKWCAANNKLFMAWHWDLLRKYRVVGRSRFLAQTKFLIRRLVVVSIKLARRARRRLAGHQNQRKPA